MEKVTHEQAFLVAALCSVVKKRERTRRWRVAHPEKDLESSRKWKINNPDKVRESGRRRSRRWRNNLEKTGDTNRKKKTCAENPKNARDRAARNALKRKYGTKANEHLLEQVEKQGRCCAICKRPFLKTPHLDHNHINGALRGALCGECNTGLGLLQENIKILQSAVKYLLEWE